MLMTDRAALVIVDVQGKLAELMFEKDRLYDNLVKFTKAAKLMSIPIIWNEQIPEKLGVTIPELAELLVDQKPIAKNSFSCCGNEEFMAALKSSGRKQVILCGIESHVCVYQTAIDLLKDSYEVHLLTDAISSRTPENYELGIHRMESAGAVATSVEMALFEMLKIAEGDIFRQVIRIVK